ncbi:MAG TPA: DNA repair protein RadA [Desulfurivibrio alkaliphilus]|uniref:DNA repair protein RadA n=1 Tax=Desulfurivibrio alkaliphilus TaxID=427923 RepID=A0A7C2TH90_9BACT|nr:DNA repair protein RadA [Desulfurivibrio alkaliphilus]
MAKKKISYLCSACGEATNKWAGQCPACGAWNTLEEGSRPAAPAADSRLGGYSGAVMPVQELGAVELAETPRIGTGLAELDRVLGGGLVAGSVVLVGGDPGVGKSTALLQVGSNLAERHKVLYVSGEESPRQIAMSSRRLGLADNGMLLLAETVIENILATAAEVKPRVLVIDSIQTMQVGALASAPGSVSQVRESAALLTRMAKQSGTAVFLVGHVTKSGNLAGPRVLEHMIDVVCYFEGNLDSRYRLLRAVKNRFGAVNELGVFAMTDRGLKEVSNPSAIFLSREGEPAPGSLVTVLWEGSRPLLVELQALVDQSRAEIPKRLAVGLENNRLGLLLAVLHRHGRLATYDRDVFVNVVGGVRVNETAADLGLLLAVASSLANRTLPRDLVVFGEVGLAGEVRPVLNGQERLREAAKHGFKRAIIPKANAPREPIKGLQVTAVAKLAEALETLT